MGFSISEQQAAQKLIEMGFAEDLGDAGTDVTSEFFIPPERLGQAAYVARSPGVLAGQPVVELIYAQDQALTYEPLVADGTRLGRGTVLGSIRGPMRAILRNERLSLNFLQHLSGVASLTRRYVERVADLSCRVLDTRKTTPGWRLLEKYAVRCGGGTNHRMGLFDGILIKDNHLAAVAPMTLAEALKHARSQAAPRLPLEVEVDTLEQLDEALSCGPDIVLLDNMTLDQLREAVRRRDQRAPQVQLEASGGVSLETVRGIAETGVDRISVGALTHSAAALDIGLDYLS
jgi:nicotinate-nucleotide pyrophosphorylase (carboxylating)